jgi:hypothetical protein
MSNHIIENLQKPAHMIRAIAAIKQLVISILLIKLVLPTFHNGALAFFGAKNIIKPSSNDERPNNNTVHFESIIIIIYAGLRI